MSRATLPTTSSTAAVPTLPPSNNSPTPESLFPEARRRRRHRRWIVGGIAVLLLVGVLGLVLVSEGGRTPHERGLSTVHPKPRVSAITPEQSASPTSCSFGPTPGFLEGTVKVATATTIGVSAGTACTDNFPVGPTTSICWATCSDTWANVLTRLTPQDVVDIQASTNASGSVTVDWIDINSVSGQGVVTAVESSNEVDVQLTRGGGTDMLLISPSTITQRGSETATGSSALLQAGDAISFTGGAVGPGPNSPDVYALRVSVDA